jgi:hypothetical protein
VFPGLPPVLEEPESDDESSETEASIRDSIYSLLAGNDIFLEFSSTLTIGERTVHLEAEQLGLLHRSNGTGEARRVTVKRRLLPDQDADSGTANEVPNVTSDDEPEIRSSKRSRKHPTYLDNYV